MTNFMKIYILFPDLTEIIMYFSVFRSTKFQTQMLNQVNKDSDITKEAFLFN